MLKTATGLQNQQKPNPNWMYRTNLSFMESNSAQSQKYIICCRKSSESYYPKSSAAWTSALYLSIKGRTWSA